MEIDGLKRLDNDDAYKKYIHEPSGIVFIYIEGSSFEFGFDADQLEFLKEHSELGFSTFSKAPPPCMVRLEPFFVSAYPVLSREMRKVFNEEFQDVNQPAYATYEVWIEFCKKYHFDVPTERQIEYIMKTQCPDLFAWGRSINDDDLISPWMEDDFDLPHGVTKDGFCGFYFPTITSTDYHYEDRVPDAKSGKVAKGGGASFWPWQWEEWVNCLPSFYFSSAEIPERELTSRVIINVTDSDRRVAGRSSI